MEKGKLIIAHKASGPINEDQSNEEAKLYKILLELPKPDVKMKLSNGARYWWYWFGVEFIETNQFSTVDLMHLQKAAFWMDARCQAYFEIKTKGYKGGLVQTFQSGATNVSGHVSIVEKADKHLDEVSAHFGLSIRDRQKLKVEETNDSQLSLFTQTLQSLAQ